MNSFDGIQADLVSHRIEGIAVQGNTSFDVPLISQIDGNLWQGGCKNEFDLKGRFKHIISLFPWEQYNPGVGLESFIMVKLEDADKIPNPDQLYSLARWVNVCRKLGPTLVHCQAGLNRSALLTGLALILSGMKAEDAIRKMRRSRSPAVLCNKTFERWLLEQKCQTLTA